MSTKETNPKDLVGVRKAPMCYVPPRVLAEVGLGMMEGALKYTPYNWRKAGVRMSVYFDGTMRHLNAWWEGQDIDPDSQLSHITKAITSLIVLRDSMMEGNTVDDRPPASTPNYLDEMNKRASALVDKYTVPPAQSHEELTFAPLADADGWIEWKGVGCPVPLDTIVEIRLDGVEYPRKERARTWNWDTKHVSGGRKPVTSYRVVKDDDGWLEWNGGECPVQKDTMVVIKWRCGIESDHAFNAGTYRWNHAKNEADIIAYRVVK